VTIPKERPILFNGPMVRAIMAGCKTQTRRAIKNLDGVWVLIEENYSQQEPNKALVQDECGNYHDMPCPYGQPGDRLYVRETFVVESSLGVDPYEPPFTYNRPIRFHSDSLNGDWWEQCHYRATDDPPELYYEDMEDPGCRWRPSIHMPKWAARIWLEITDVRVERVQDISYQDCLSEGIPQDGSINNYGAGGKLRDAFAEFWDSTSGRWPEQSWKNNPWVWVVEFKVLKS
jgi:hypothetical protein